MLPVPYTTGSPSIEVNEEITSFFTVMIII